MDWDLELKNNELQSSATKLFGGVNKVLTLMKLNNLPLVDLKRSKYDIINEQILFFEKNYNSAEINLSKSLDNQGKILLLRSDNSSAKKN